MDACFLVGPTAVGKSAVAQFLAERDGYDLLSADSMVVYYGMDIGTAKPGADEQARAHYAGIDLVSPDESFNAWQYRQHALAALRDSASRERAVLVVGGTGLYVKVLTHGLGTSWADAEPTGAPLAGLRRPVAALNSRIEARVRAMYRDGLVAEVERLRAQTPGFSRTAGQAIGYAEAVALLDGALSREQAIERTVIRTRQLAKRQRTWFRHQADVRWIDVDQGMNVAAVAQRVKAHWEEHGPTRIKC